MKNTIQAMFNCFSKYNNALELYIIGNKQSFMRVIKDRSELFDDRLILETSLKKRDVPESVGVLDLI